MMAREPRSYRTSLGPQSGFVLPLAILLMVGIVVIAVGAMEVTLTHASYGNARLDRVIASGLADGGIDLGYQRLADNSAFRGTFSESTSSGDVIEVTVAEVSGGLQITSTSTYGSVVRGARAHLQPAAGLGNTGEFLRPMETQGNLTIKGGKLEVIGGAVLHGGLLATRFGGSAIGDFQSGAPLPLSIDSEVMVDGASRVIKGTTLAAGSHECNALVQGNLYLTAPTTITGRLVVDGHLTINGVGSVVLGTVDQPLDLVVTGQVNVNLGITSTEMNGLFICTNRFGLWYAGTLVGRGGLYVSSFEMDAIDGTWTFDADFLNELDGVSGLPVYSDVSTYSEVWREPLVNPK